MLNEATRQFIREHRTDDVKRLALQSKPATSSGIDLRAALTQIAGRQLIEHKIPSWSQQDEVIYPARLPIEQCSSEATARYKSSLLTGDSFTDLTGGFGVDTTFISSRFRQTQYVERQAELVAIARHNFAVLGLPSIQIHNADSTDFLPAMQPVDCLYLDPSRRSLSGQKIVRIEDCEPDVLSIQDTLLSKAKTVLLKLSPMLDLRATCNAFRNVYQIHIVSVNNECKELLVLLRRNFSEEPEIHCIHIGRAKIQSDIFTQSEERNITLTCTHAVKKYLYEPNASIMKGGFYKSLGQRYAVEPFHPDSHLYTSDNPVPDFPGRSFQVEALSTFSKKNLKNLLQAVDRANLTVRNFPLTVEQLRKQLKLREGGDTYLFATTLSDGRRVLLKTLHRTGPEP